MRYLNVLTSAAFIVYGILGIVDASSTDPITAMKSKWPVYDIVYNSDEKDERKTILDGKKSSFTPGDLDKFPYKRSALHRAIELMDSALVKWLLDNGAYFDYGLVEDKMTGDKNIVPSKELKEKDLPVHLVAHLEAYYREDKKTEAEAILSELHDKGLNVAIWPVGKESFKKLRDEWNSDGGTEKYDPDLLAYSSISSATSTSGSI